MEKNENIAEQAYELCQDAYKHKDHALARIYLLNAITHNTQLRYLKVLVTIVKKTEYSERQDAARQALEIFSVALLQAPPDQVVQIRELMDEMQDICDDDGLGTSSENESDSGHASPVLNMEEELEVFSWNNYRKNGWLCSAEKLQEKEAALKQTLESGLLDDAKANEIFNELLQTQLQIGFCAAKAGFYEAVKEVEGELRKDNPIAHRVAALMSKTANALNQIWSLPNGPMLESEIESEQNAAQAKFETIEPDAQRIISEKAHDAIRDLEVKYKDALGEVFTPRIELLQKKALDLQELLPLMTYKPYRDEVVNRIKATAEKITALTRQRLARYQQMAADYALKAIKSFDEMSLVFKKDAERILADCHLAEIDESLLSPEASSLFQSAKSIVTAKLDVEKRAEFDHKCVVTAKFKLEQY